MTALTAPRVPTGMKAGVCTTPCGVRSTPRRAPRRRRRAVIVETAKALGVIGSSRVRRFRLALILSVPVSVVSCILTP